MKTTTKKRITNAEARRLVATRKAFAKKPRTTPRAYGKMSRVARKPVVDLIEHTVFSGESPSRWRLDGYRWIAVRRDGLSTPKLAATDGWEAPEWLHAKPKGILWSGAVAKLLRWAGPENLEVYGVENAPGLVGRQIINRGFVSWAIKNFALRGKVDVGVTNYHNSIYGRRVPVVIFDGAGWRLVVMPMDPKLTDSAIRAGALPLETASKR